VIKEIIESADICLQIIKARAAVALFKNLRLITPSQEKSFNTSIDDLEKRNFVFITKPFRSHESMGCYAYALMKSRIIACKNLLDELDKHENQ
jgi:hypothetical protein